MMTSEFTALDRCVQCRHRVSSPESVARGMGPVCFHRYGVAQVAARREVVRAHLDALVAQVDVLEPRALLALLHALDDFGGVHA